MIRSRAASLFLQNMATRIAVEHGIPVLLVSSALLRGLLVERLASIEGSIAPAAMHSGTMDGQQWVELSQAATRLAAAPLWIDDSPAPSVDQIAESYRLFRANIAKQAEATEPDAMQLIAVDTLELLRPAEGWTTNDPLADIIRGLKALAMDAQLPVVLSSRQPSTVAGRLLGSAADTIFDLRAMGEREHALTVLQRRMGPATDEAVLLREDGFRYNDVIASGL